MTPTGTGETTQAELTETWLSMLDLADPPSGSKFPRTFHERSGVHRLVMSLFPETLPGDESERRSTSRILYRVESVNGSPRILIQSALAPNGVQTKNISVHLASFTSGCQVVLRTQINVVTSKARSNKRVTVAAEQIPEWFTSKFTGIADTEVLDVTYTPLLLDCGKKPLPLDTAIIDAVCTIGDADRFGDFLRNGIGRARAYGCGLITAAHT